MENTEIIDKIKSSIECTICFEKFIKLSYERLCIFYEDNKNILPQTFEDDNCGRCCEDRCEWVSKRVSRRGLSNYLPIL